ncbi:MAG TPA: hypothetical protein PLH82_01515 [Candidatus Paceibacterota bacterium]|nr:hypothetical protein [Candidatus Paceibacterota bacterium]
MANNSLAVFRVEYELLPVGSNVPSNWTAFVVSFTPEEVLEYLEKLMGKGRVKLISIGFQCNVHGFTPEAREFLTTIGIRKDAPSVTEVKIGKESSTKKIIKK